jgi:hypothetical protein
LVQSLNRSTPALALNKVTATVRNYQPFCEIKEIKRRTDRALHPDQWQQTLFATQIFFGDDQAVQLELWNAFSWRRRLSQDNPENAPFVQAARFLLLEYHLKHHQQATAENRHCWRTRPQS